MATTYPVNYPYKRNRLQLKNTDALTPMLVVDGIPAIEAVNDLNTRVAAVENGTSAVAQLDVTGTAEVGGLLSANAGISKGTANVTEFTVLTTLTATQIVGTAAGDIGNANGAILVAAPSSDYALEFVSAVLIYD